MNNDKKLNDLKSKLAFYEDKLKFKMKTYHGVIHESALSELKHSEVMVLRSMVDDLKKEIQVLQTNRSQDNF